MVKSIGFINAMSPRVLSLIDRVETLLHLLKTNPVSAAVVACLREVCVGDITPYLGLCGCKLDGNGTRFCAAHAMLESVLDERDEE